MIGYGIKPFAPRIPYVTTTILVKRPFGWLLGPFWKMLYWLIRRLIYQWFSSVGAGTEPIGFERTASGGNLIPPDEPWSEPVGFGQDDYM